MSWEEVFVKRAALEKLAKEELLAENEESEEPEGVTIEPRNREAENKGRQAQQELNEGLLRKE